MHAQVVTKPSLATSGQLTTVTHFSLTADQIKSQTIMKYQVTGDYISKLTARYLKNYDLATYQRI